MTDTVDPRMAIAAIHTATAALASAIGDQPPPCWSEGDRWFNDPTTAAALCLHDCHALTECSVYADAVDPRYGVWAGQDRERRRKPADLGRIGAT